MANNVRLAHRLCNRVGYTEVYGVSNARDRAKVEELREAAVRGRSHVIGPMTPSKDDTSRAADFDLGRIPSLLAERLHEWGLEFPRHALTLATSGHLSGLGWHVQYAVGEDRGVPFLEYYATNRFVWGDIRARIYANGEILDDLDTIEPVVVTRAGEDRFEAERAYLERNQRVASELRELGLFPETDINSRLRTNRQLSDEPEDGAGRSSSGELET